MVIIRGTQRRVSITTTARLILDANPDREGYTLLADPGNTNNIFIGFDDPAVTATGDKAGVRLQPSEQINESPPGSFTGEIYALTNTGTETLIIREDSKR